MHNQKEEFLQYFNDLHQVFKKQTNNDRLTFSEAIEEFSNYNNKYFSPAVKKNKDVLKVINDLRNVIVHNRSTKFPEIAFPTEYPVEILKEVAESFIKPKRFSHFVKKGNAISFNENTMLSEVLETIQKTEYSQFPVFSKDEFKGLISENGITSWIAKSFKPNDGVLVLDTEIKNVLELDENQKNYAVYYKENKLFNLLKKFEENNGVNSKITVLVVEKKNKELKRPEDIVGIITGYDLPEVFRILNL